MVDTAEDKEPLWKKSQESKDDRKKFFTIFIILIVIAVIMITAFIVTLPPIKKKIYSDLRLDGIEVRRLNDEYVDDNTTSTELDVVIYLTNDGEMDSGLIKIDAYIKSFDTRGIETPCNSMGTISLGSIETESTGKNNLTLPRVDVKHEERYTIEFYIWEDKKVVEIATTTIKVPYINVTPEPDVISDDADDEPGKSGEKEDYMTPGFEAISFIITLVVILFLFRNQRNKRR